LASFLVNNCTPSSIAPNTITLFGLCWMIVSYASLWFYAPAVSTPVPSILVSQQSEQEYAIPIIPNWVFCYHCCALLIYQTLDNMDGKQARRTGSSSPLGLLFDHGCDAINSIFGSAGWIVGLGFTLQHDYYACLAIILGPFAMFYVATWEEYYTGELILPIINGPNEGLLGGALLSLTTCFYPDFWQSTSLSDALRLQQLFSSPLRNADIQVSLAVFGMFQELVAKTALVSKRYGVQTIVTQAPLWILIVLFLMNTNLWESMPRTALHLCSGLFVELVTQLMLDHITDQPFHTVRRCLVLLPLLILTVMAASTTQEETEYAGIVSISTFWLMYTTALWTFLVCKIRWVVHEICCVLDLKCFDITTKPKVV
jgi:ethanolaminephosphotransferase